MIRNVPVDLMGSSCLQWCVKDEDGLCELSAVKMQISLSTPSLLLLAVTPSCIRTTVGSRSKVFGCSGLPSIYGFGGNMAAASGVQSRKDDFLEGG